MISANLEAIWGMSDMMYLENFGWDEKLKGELVMPMRLLRMVLFAALVLVPGTAFAGSGGGGGGGDDDGGADTEVGETTTAPQGVEPVVAPIDIAAKSIDYSPPMTHQLMARAVAGIMIDRTLRTGDKIFEKVTGVSGKGGTITTMKFLAGEIPKAALEQIVGPVAAETAVVGLSVVKDQAELPRSATSTDREKGAVSTVSKAAEDKLKGWYNGLNILAGTVSGTLSHGAPVKAWHDSLQGGMHTPRARAGSPP
jgi:hypothetical protein